MQDRSQGRPRFGSPGGAERASPAEDASSSFFAVHNLAKRTPAMPPFSVKTPPDELPAPWGRVLSLIASSWRQPAA